MKEKIYIFKKFYYGNHCHLEITGCIFVRSMEEYDLFAKKDVGEYDRILCTRAEANAICRKFNS